MNKHTIFTVLFYVLSIIFNVAAIITFANGNPDSNGAVWLCLGSSLLCIGTVFTRREKKDEEKKDDGKTEE